MYNFGRVTGETGPERYCDSSEMGIVLGRIDAFPPNFITQVRGTECGGVDKRVPKVLALYPCLNLRLSFRRITSALGECYDRYLRLAAKAKRQGDGTDTSIDIELHSIAQPQVSWQ